MIAMTASSDNADEMRDKLVKELNKARQQKITNEVLEVVSGSEALSNG
jgi:F-type H+-transporting ATPase subunit gamma